MFNTAHAAIGVAATTALGVNEPALAFTVGWLFHYAADAIPHGDERLGCWAMKQSHPTRVMAVFFALDVAVIALVLLAINATVGVTLVMLAAVVGSMVPDVLLGMELVFARRTLSWLSRVHNAAHKATGLVFSLKYGLPAQTTLAVLMWYIAISSS